MSRWYTTTSIAPKFCPKCTENNCWDDFVCKLGKFMDGCHCCDTCYKKFKVLTNMNMNGFISKFKSDEKFQKVFECREKLKNVSFIKANFEYYGEECIHRPTARFPPPRSFYDYGHNIYNRKMQRKMKNVRKKYRREEKRREEKREEEREEKRREREKRREEKRREEREEKRREEKRREEREEKRRELN
ncbi:unnamed protein product [Gordionus sp. m RMFG-2023]